MGQWGAIHEFKKHPPLTDRRIFDSEKQKTDPPLDSKIRTDDISLRTAKNVADIKLSSAKHV
jgi:hypothetical protein